MRSVRLLIPIIALAAILAAGCGSSGDSTSATEPGERAGTSAGASQTAPAGASAQSCGETTVAGTRGLRVTGIGCDVGRGVVAGWANKPGCSQPPGASRYSCTVYDGYRCQGSATEHGIAVSCARPGRSLAFVAKPG